MKKKAKSVVFNIYKYLYTYAIILYNTKYNGLCFIYIVRYSILFYTGAGLITLGLIISKCLGSI